MSKSSKKTAPKEITAAQNIQRYAYLVTINNPEKHGFTHSKIKETLITNFPTLQFFCMADEIGLKEHTKHTHMYVTFTSRVRLKTVKKHFPPAHIDIARASAEANIDYVKKSGRWEGTEKEETKVEGTYEEWGKPPKQKGRNQDLAELYELVSAGYSNAQILAINHDYILQIDKMDKLRTTLLIEKYKNTRRLDLKVIYVQGKTSLGKTRDILDTFGDANVHRVTDYTHKFDNYCTHPVILFEEFRSQIQIYEMLCYCDIYPVELPSRYHNKFACYHTVYIASNWPLEDQYRDIQVNQPDTYQAFLRRISNVKVYNSNGTITNYPSVSDYMATRSNNIFPFKSKISDNDFSQLMPKNTVDKDYNGPNK